MKCIKRHRTRRRGTLASFRARAHTRKAHLPTPPFTSPHPRRALAASSREPKRAVTRPPHGLDRVKTRPSGRRATNPEPSFSRSSEPMSTSSFPSPRPRTDTRHESSCARRKRTRVPSIESSPSLTISHRELDADGVVIRQRYVAILPEFVNDDRVPREQIACREPVDFQRTLAVVIA